MCSQWVWLSLIEILYWVAFFSIGGLLMGLDNCKSEWSLLYLVVGGIDLILSIFHYYQFRTESLPRGLEGMWLSFPIVPFLGCCCEKGENYLDRHKNYISWLAIRHTLWVIMMFLWMVPSFIYVDRVGGWWGGSIISYNNMSSCQNMYFVYDKSATGRCLSTKPIPLPPNNVYNPHGALGDGKIWEKSIPYANCYMDQLWKQPSPNINDQIILGYETTLVNSIPVPNCLKQKNPGAVSYRNCFTEVDDPGMKDGICIGSFPDIAIGFPIPSAGIDYLDTNNNTAFANCPSSGTVNDPQPRFICPYCLWYWMSVVAQENGIPISAGRITTQCFPDWIPGSKTQPLAVPLTYASTSVALCGLCPSRGRGWFDWNYSYDGITCSYWLFNTITWFLPLLRWISVMTIVLWKENKKIKHRTI